MQPKDTIPNIYKTKSVDYSIFYVILLWGDAACNCNSNNLGSKQHFTVTEQVTVALLKCTHKKHTKPAPKTNCKV